MTDIFFITDKTNALLKATGWDMLTISIQLDMLNMDVKIRAHLNNEVIGNTQLPYRLLSNDTLDEQKKIVVKFYLYSLKKLYF